MPKHQIFGQVAVVLLALVLLQHGELVEDVGGGVLVEAVEVEVEGVEAGTELAALGGVPDVGIALVAEVAGERG